MPPPTAPCPGLPAALPLRWRPAQSALLQAAALFSFLAASSVATPLYRLYQASWGFSSLTLTLVFGVYAVSLLAALLCMGSLSDHVGRRPVILAALLLEAAAMAVFAAAGGVAALLAGRTLQGLATGMATSALGAGLLDADRRNGPLVNSVAPIAGLAAGALASALLAGYLADPLHDIFDGLLALFLLLAALLWFLPETAGRKPGAWASLRPRVGVPAQARRALLSVAPVDVAIWALGGFYLSLGPSLARLVTGSDSALPGGLAVFALSLSGALAVLLLRGQPAARLMRGGAAALATGVLLTLAGVHAGQSWLFFAGTAVAGAGFGAAFQGAVRTVMPLAEPHQRAGLMAALYVLSYLAFCLPALAAGAAVGALGLARTTDGYATVVAVLALSALARRPRPGGAG